MRDSAKVYLDFLVQSRTQHTIYSEFLASLKMGRTVLISASVEPFIREFAELYGVDYLASTLEVVGELYTGKMLQDLSGKKLPALMGRFGEDALGEESYCYTDNLSDLELVKKCKHRTIILLKPNHRQRWGPLEARYIEDYQ